MNNLSEQVPDFSNNQVEGGSLLWQYVQSLSPEAVAQLSQPSSEVLQVMERTIVQMLGLLPPQHFGVTITTSRENLGRLLASATMHGYFLHNAQQRMAFENSLLLAEPGRPQNSLEPFMPGE